jgi:hypothetical protein
MSVIPTVYNQGTGLIGSTTSGAAIPSNIDDLIINDTLLVGGEATFNGAVTVNNSLTVSGGITFQDVTVQGTFILEGKTPTQLAFYTTGGELTGTADMTYSGGITTLTNVTVTTALSFGALTKTDPNNYAVAFHDNNRICIAGSPNVLTYNPSEGNLAVPNVTVDSTMTANIVSADELRIEPIDVTSQDNFLPIPMIDTTNQNQIVVDGDENNNLAYNPNRNTFRTNKAQFTNDVTMDATLSVEDDVTLVNGDLTISNGDLSIGSLPEGNFSGVDFEMAFFNPNNGKFFKRTGYTLRGNTAVLTLDEVEISDTLTVTNDTTLARTFVTPTSRNNDEDYRIAIIDKDNGQICREQNDSDFFYNTQDNKLTVKNLDVTDTANISITPATRGTSSVDYQVVFYDATTSQFCIDDNSTQFTYDPNLNKLKVGTVEATNVVVDQYLTLTTPLTWSADDDNPITFLTPNDRFYIAPSNNPLTFNGNSGMLKTPRLTLTNVTVPGTSAEFPLLLYNTGTEEVKRSSSVTNTITCDPLNGKLTVHDLLINTKCVVNTEARSNDYEYRFVLQDQATFQLVRDSALLTMTYNPLEERFTCKNVDLQKLTLATGSIFNHSGSVYMALRGQVTSNFDFSIAFWNDGHTRYQTTDDSGGHRFYTRNTTTNTPTQRFQIDHDQIVCSTEFFANNGATIQAATFSDDINCRVTFLNSNGNSGKVVSNNQLFFNPDNETLRTTNMNVNGQLNLTSASASSGQMNVDSTLYFVYNHATGHTFRIGGNWKLRLFNTSTVIYTPLFLQDVTVPAASASLPILLHNSSNEVEKTNVSGTNQITIDPSQGLLTTKDIYVNGSIYNNVLALNYTTVYSCDTWSCSLGTPPYFGNNNYIERDTDNTNFTNPRVSQYGQDIVNSINNTAIRSAIDFQTDGTYWGIATDDYKGWWYVDAALVYQNTLTGSNDRVVPYIRIIKSSGGLDIEQRQISKGIQYMRFTQGELSTIRCQGPVYLANTNQYLRICTLLEIGNIPSGGGTGEPTWPDTTTGFRGLDISIAMRFLGVSASDNETVNAL